MPFHSSQKNDFSGKPFIDILITNLELRLQEKEKAKKKRRKQKIM